MSLEKFMKGLHILLPFYDKPDGYHLGAEHDQIYIYATDRPVGADDVAELLSLGFFQPDVHLPEDQDEATVADYKPDKGWSVYV